MVYNKVLLLVRAEFKEDVISVSMEMHNSAPQPFPCVCCASRLNRASINHGRTMDETWTIHGQLASILAAQRLRHALSRKRCAARSIGVHERPWHINVPKSHFYELIL